MADLHEAIDRLRVCLRAYKQGHAMMRSLAAESEDVLAAYDAKRGGEAVAWMRPEEIAHLAKQEGVAHVPAWNCPSGDARIPLYTYPAPPPQPTTDDVREKLSYVIRYGSDTLSGPMIECDRVKWYRDGVREMLKRARAVDAMLTTPDDVRDASCVSVKREAAIAALTQRPERPAAVVVNGVALIAAERRRQVESEWWTPEHDDEHDEGELACAAACYATPERERVRLMHTNLPDLWPFGGESPEESGWKPTPDNRIRELVKAGALIAAEIDRLQRAAITGERHG